ncbi:MAG: TIGR03960 family B12-binding radical SAM protein [Coriobacteriales bacterium]|jgi:radical SAM family uncharacterized protein|nr:TIGR03960 family B12-binding radical SAM protein [Coriobacteriales bacterium]
MAHSLYSRIEPLFSLVEKPSRYLGNEYQHCTNLVIANQRDNNTNQDKKGDASVYDIVFCYPDTYEIGQANQGIAILAACANKLDDVNVKRTFLPWLDMSELLREHNIPLFSLEDYMPIKMADMIAITLPHELAATNVLELIDLAGVALRAADRKEDDPIIIGGGPVAFNPEPLADFFDVFGIGEGEDLILEVIETDRYMRDSGASRIERIQKLAGIPGIYVPSFSLHSADFKKHALNAKGQIVKRIVDDFNSTPVLISPKVPYAEVAHDRLTVEILRGCTRGCRFCQAGMTSRPVRERTADSILAAVSDGLKNTGYDEVSLTSLSSTDHSQINAILRRLQHLVCDSDISISLPSQRLDAFGVFLAQIVEGGARKTGLTFAPEAATQRLRDVINKNVTDANLLDAIQSAFLAGWRRCKLYFMIGLPTETDEDIVAIATLVNQAYACAKDSVPEKQRGQVRISVSVAVFVPKAQTPFQWCGQLARSEVQRRIALLRNSGLHKGIDLHWHDPSTSLIEAALSRGGRQIGSLIEAAWRLGAKFDAWTEQFSLAIWEQAATDIGVSLDALATRDFAIDEPLPWDHISAGVSKEYLASEMLCATKAQTQVDCSFSYCSSCGVCSDLGVRVRLAGKRCA